MNIKQISKIWATPLLLAVLTLFGLLSALLGTGYWYALAWLALITPIIVISWLGLKFMMKNAR